MPIYEKTTLHGWFFLAKSHLNAIITLSNREVHSERRDKVKDIRTLQAIVDSLEEWVIVMGYLASCPRPYTPMDKYMIITADKKIERALKLLKKEVRAGAKMAGEYQQYALRLRNPDMNQDAIASCIILNGIVVQTNAQIERFNAYLNLCEHHI